ncbi:MAG TPA: hypothetical protein VH353_11240 [Caulobacteraceae bacterium]|jgi:hypothetical protein|nr:hypothetical protein [Caulobacteraceae bacterium]
MIRRLFSAWIDRFEKTWSYDASYFRRMLAASPSSVLKFSFASGMVQRHDAPAAALAATGIAGTLAEDCGPCLQLTVDMASRSGVDPGVLRAILARNEAAMGEDAATAWRFASAVLEKRLDEADAARDAVLARWGEKGLVALSLTLTTARMYPTVKYALGYGRACSRVTVAGETAPAVRTPALAA